MEKNTAMPAANETVIPTTIAIFLFLSIYVYSTNLQNLCRQVESKISFTLKNNEAI
jgi:cell division protein FtsX